MNQKAKTTNQKQATTDGMRKFLTDQIRKNGGEIEFEELLKVSFLLYSPPSKSVLVLQHGVHGNATEEAANFIRKIWPNCR